MPVKTLQQKYAEAVYRCIQDVKQSYPDEKGKEYGALALKLPILVRQAGLVQALTFVAARQQDKHKRRILDDLAKVLGAGTGDDLLEQARKASLPEYMLHTQKILLALEWFKRFAQSELKVEPGEGE